MTKIEYEIMDTLREKWRVARSSYSEEYSKVADELVAKGIISTNIVCNEVYYVVTLKSLRALAEDSVVEETVESTELEEEIKPSVEKESVEVSCESTNVVTVEDVPKKVSKPRTKKAATKPVEVETTANIEVNSSSTDVIENT